MEKNIEQSPIVKNALQKKIFREKSIEDQERRKNDITRVMIENGEKRAKERELIQEAKIAKVKNLVDENIKFLKSNDDILLGDEIEFFITLLSSELKIRNDLY